MLLNYFHLHVVSPPSVLLILLTYFSDKNLRIYTRDTPDSRWVVRGRFNNAIKSNLPVKWALGPEQKYKLEILAVSHLFH